MKVDCQVTNYKTKEVLLSYEVFLPAVASSRLVLDFIPASQGDASIINGYGGIVKTPEYKAKVRPVLKVDGVVVATGETIYIGERIGWNHIIDGKIDERPPKDVGVMMTIAYDAFNVSSDYLEKVKEELENIDISSVQNDSTREKYLGRYADLLAKNFLLRNLEATRRTYDLLHIKSNYHTGLYSTLVYTYPSNLSTDFNVAFGIHPSWGIDAYHNGGAKRKILTNESIAFLSEFGVFASNLYMYGGSYNEGLVFEDWQSTYGANSIRTLMAANEQGIPVVKLTASDVKNGHLYVLENQTIDRYPDYTIKSFITALVDGGATITAPVRKINYEGMSLTGYLEFSAEHMAYFFNMNNGGGSTDTTVDNSNFETTTIVGADASGQEYLSGDSSLLSFETTGSEVYIDTSSVEAMTVADGDPVDMVKGEFYQDERPDIHIKAAGSALEISRKYKSQSTYNGPFGYGWTWAHMERLLFSADGSLIYFNKDGVPANIKSSGGAYVYPPGAEYTLAKTSTGYTITNKDKSKIYFASDGKLTKKEDLYGNYTTFGYNAQGRINKLVSSTGKSIVLTYNSNNKIVKATDFLGRSVTYAYDGSDLVAFTDLQGNTTRYEYLKNQDNPANNHNMSKYILPTGDFLEISYYKNDKVSHHTNKKGETFNFQYSMLNRYAETWNESGYYKKVFFNESNDVIRTSTKDKTVETKEYDENHNVIVQTDANGFSTTFTYDSQRNMISKTNALGETWHYEYDLRFNKKSKITDPNGNTTRFTYNSEGNLVSKIDASGSETLYSYDNRGNMIKSVDSLGNVVENIYDDFGVNLVARKDKNGNVTTYQYDQIGNMISKTDPLAYTTRYTYNAYKQKLSETDPAGNTIQYVYNKNRKLVKKLLPNGGMEVYRYDIARDIVTGEQLIEATDPIGNSIHYRYDAVGNKISETDKNGNTTRFVYDELNRVIEKIDANQNSIYYSYDGNGKLIRETKVVETVDGPAEFVRTYQYDAAGRKTRYTDFNGNVEEYVYDKAGNLIAKTLHDSQYDIRTEYAYDTTGRLISQILGAGTADARSYSISYDSEGRKNSSTDPLGQVTRYFYDAQGNLLEKTLNGVRLEGYLYDANNRPIQISDGNGNITRVEYDAVGRKTALIDPLGNKKTYAYDSVGNLVEETNALGNKTSYSYNLLGKRIKETDVYGNITRYAYDKNGNTVSVTDPSGNKNMVYYDSMNRKIAQEDALGNTTTFDYDALGKMVKQVNALGEVTDFVYDANGNMIKKIQYGNKAVATELLYNAQNKPISVTDGNGNTTTIGYNVFGEQVIKTDAMGNTQKTVYDGMGRVVESINANGVASRYTYDARGNVLSLTQAADTAITAVTRYEYDANGNRIKEIKENGSETVTTEITYDARNLPTAKTVGNITVSSVYNATGNMIRQIDGNGNTTTYTYDNLGRRIASIDALGNTTGYRYDERGNVVTVVSPEGAQRFITYDAMNHKLREVIDNAEKGYAYDALGRLIRESDFNANVTSYTYDALGRLSKKTEAEGSYDEAVTRYTYDAVGNMTAITDAKNARIVYIYDKANRRVKEIDADGSYQSVQYDGNGNITLKRMRDGTQIQYTYDDLNRKTAVRVDGTLSQSFTYDRFSRMSRAVDYNSATVAHTVEYEYDVFNRVTAETQDGRRVEKTYDAASNVALLTYSSGKTLQYNYDAVNNIKTIGADGNTLAALEYNANNRLTTMQTGNGMTQTITYDERHREIEREYEVSGRRFSQTTEYDEASNVIEEILNTNGRTKTNNYYYDDRNRVVKNNISNTVWKYDTVGNWTFTNQNGYNEKRYVNSDNEYTQITNNQPQYDANGNIAVYDGKHFVYDYLNRLTAVKSGDTTIATYTYDAMNRRVSKSTQNATITYVYDGEKVIEEYDGTTLMKSYVYGHYIDDVILMETGGKKYYFAKDRQYSTRAIVDESGNIVESYDYNAFGLMKIYDASGTVISHSAVDNIITYTGRHYDVESGMYHYRNRIYSPKLGRFLQRDPKGYVDGMNLYAYVRNNPLKSLDPMGTTTMTYSEFQASQELSNNDFAVTGAVGVQWSGDAGVSAGGGIGIFGSVSYEDGDLDVVVGFYVNGETGAGATATGASGGFGFEVSVYDDDYTTALNGLYVNTGGSVGGGLDLGYDMTTTLPDPTTGDVTSGWTINIGFGTPTIDGHIRPGDGTTFGEWDIY